MSHSRGDARNASVSQVVFRRRRVHISEQLHWGPHYRPPEIHDLKLVAISLYDGRERTVFILFGMRYAVSRVSQ